jgi:hypothetical protein
MKATIEVKSRDEAANIIAGLQDPATRALVITIGALLSLRTYNERRRVMQWVIDRMDEDDSHKEPSHGTNA